MPGKAGADHSPRVDLALKLCRSSRKRRKFPKGQRLAGHAPHFGASPLASFGHPTASSMQRGRALFILLKWVQSKGGGGVKGNHINTAEEIEGQNLQARKGYAVGFAIVCFFVCCAFVESYCWRFVADAMLTVAYWVMSGSLGVPTQFEGTDEVARLNRAVFLREKLSAINKALGLAAIVLVALNLFGRWVKG